MSPPDRYEPGPDWNGPSEEENRVDLHSLIGAIWRRKWLIVFCALAGAGLAALMVAQIAPRYTARAAVMLDARSVQVLASDDVVSDLTLSNALLDSEVAVLRSNLLLENVIASVPREALASFEPVETPPGWLDAVKAEAEARLRETIAGLAARAGIEFDATPAAPAVGAADDIPPMLSPEERWQRRMLVQLRRSMTVWREGQSYVISLAVETGSPELSALLANRITEEYINSQIESRNVTARTANAFLEERVARLREEVKTAESAVERFRADQLEADGVSPEAVSQQLLQLNTQLALARAESATAEARYGQIQKIIQTEGIAAAAEVLTSPFVVSLREDLATLEREDADLATQLGPEHPDRQRLRSSMALLRESISEEVAKIVDTLRNEMAVTQTREQSLRDSMTELEERNVSISRASIGLRQLEREAEAIRGTYEATLARLSETRSIEQLQRADARVIERAVIPGAPSAPRRMLFTALGGVSGFSIGLVLVFLLGVLGRGFTTVTELEGRTGLPVLTTLPRGKWRNRRRMLTSLTKQPYQLFAERVRQLRTALGRPLAGEQARSVLLTSSVPGEGKTSTAMALAHSAALSKRRVLLLDLDTRRSPLAMELGLKLPCDLAGVLRGSCSYAEAIVSLDHYGFDILTMNRPEPGLVDEVSLDSLQDLLSALSGLYDLVVIDAPPVLAVSDTLSYSQLADVTVFLVKERGTPRRLVEAGLKRLREMKVNPMGTVLTHTDPRQEKKTDSAGRYYGYVG